MTAKRLPPELIEAYRDTRYEVLGPPVFVLRIGVKSAELIKLYEYTKLMSATFITAWNPLGELLDPAENARRQQAFVEELDAAGETHFAARGVDPRGIWRAEQSRLVLGWSKQQAIDAGRALEQNAVVYANAAARPDLLLLQQ